MNFFPRCTLLILSKYLYLRSLYFFCTACKSDNNSIKRVYKEYHQSATSSPSLAQNTAGKNNIINNQNDIEFKWQTPNTWQLKPLSSDSHSPRLATFVLPDKTECAITSFPGSVGTLKENTVRWLRQIGKASLTQDSSSSKKIDFFVEKKIISKKGKLPYYYFDLSYFVEEQKEKNTPEKVIVAALFPLQNQTLVIKLTTDSARFHKEQKNFLDLCDSISYSIK